MAEILDFYDKKLGETSTLRVFNKDTGDEIFNTDLGAHLFRKEENTALVFNRDLRVQYQYAHNPTIEVEAYIYLGTLPTVAFPVTEVQKGNILRFEMQRDTRVYEQKDELGTTSRLTFAELFKDSVWAGTQIAFIVFVFVILYLAWSAT